MAVPVDLDLGHHCETLSYFQFTRLLERITHSLDPVNKWLRTLSVTGQWYPLSQTVSRSFNGPCLHDWDRRHLDDDFTFVGSLYPPRILQTTSWVGRQTYWIVVGFQITVLYFIVQKGRPPRVFCYGVWFPESSLKSSSSKRTWKTRTDGQRVRIRRDSDRYLWS